MGIASGSSKSRAGTAPILSVHRPINISETRFNGKAGGEAKRHPLQGSTGSTVSPKAALVSVGLLISQSDDLRLSGGLIEYEIQLLTGLDLLIGARRQSLSVLDQIHANWIGIFQSGLESGDREFANRPLESHPLVAQVHDGVRGHVQDKLRAINALGSHLGDSGRRRSLRRCGSDNPAGRTRRAI